MGLGPKSKTVHTCLFELSNDFQNCMSWPSSTNGHGGDRLQGKGLESGPVLQGGDWAWILPTKKLLGTNQTTPENSVQIGPSLLQLFMIFQKHRHTDGQTNRQIDKQIHKWITPLPYTLCFFYLFTHYICWLCLLTLFCSVINLIKPLRS